MVTGDVPNFIELANLPKHRWQRLKKIRTCFQLFSLRKIDTLTSVAHLYSVWNLTVEIFYSHVVSADTLRGRCWSNPNLPTPHRDFCENSDKQCNSHKVTQPSTHCIYCGNVRFPFCQTDSAFLLNLASLCEPMDHRRLASKLLRNM